MCVLGAVAGAVSGRAATQAVVLSIEGGTNAWFVRAGQTVEAPLRVNQALEETDRVRTGERTRLTLQLADRTITRIPELSEFRVQPGAPKRPVIFTLWRGLAYFFHRDRPDELLIQSRTASAAVRGTDFVVAVDEGGRMTLSLLAGEVELRNEAGTLRLTSGEQGVAAPGKPPYRTAVLSGVNEIQWCLYYPGVLDLEGLELPDGARAALQNSLEAYRDGDLLQALARYPAERLPSTPAESVYLAALLLSVGNVDSAWQLLDAVAAAPPTAPETATTARLAGSIRAVIAAVKLEPRPSTLNFQPATLLATEWLAESYHYQARGQLAQALQAARQAAEQSPQFAFAWVRVAELEFSFVRTEAAHRALDRGLALAPRNAQALALRGFLWSAQNRIALAHASFDNAIRLDGGLGNAWLGRGLCRIRQGDVPGGLADLEVAAAVEPQRALLRSYLGKAFEQARDRRRAHPELDLAKALDPGDPTAWFYSALLLQQDNRINGAVRELEESRERNDNRQIYRSRLLLDQDLAVRGANLAAIYRDAGLTDDSVREAVRAVHVDYANFSAHSFLADSYNELRDPSQVNLRYETPWFTEYLLANLLGPVGAGNLAPAVSQHEYARLFERNRLGLFSQTEYLSSGDWQQTAVQHGRFDNTSYSAEAFYHSRDGHRPNNDLEQLVLTLRLKQQITAQDSLYFQASYGTAEGGDLGQYYDNSWASPDLRTKENQEPLLLAGYHREWRPGSHTLLLAGYVNDTLRYTNPDQTILTVGRWSTNPPAFGLAQAGQEYRNELALGTAELQQIERWEKHTIILGGRYQRGVFQAWDQQTNSPLPGPRAYDLDLERLACYGYDQWQLHPAVCVIAGLGYDWLTYPSNFRYPPISAGEGTTDQISPKAGLILTPYRDTTLRAAYTRSLGGVSLDQSFRLEPPQVAGFIQTPRSLIPESAGGTVSGERVDVAGFSLEQKLGAGTCLGLSGEWLESKASREIGTVQFALGAPSFPDGFSEAATSEELEFRERSLLFTVSQLLGDEWSVGLRYRLSQAELDEWFPASGQFTPPLEQQQNLESVLHQVELSVCYNHASGFFVQSQSLWSSQSNQGYTPDRPGDDFWQFNLFAGYRFLQRRAEFRVGVLNLTDQDYQLNPLNLTAELPRERTFFTSLTLNF
jgi:Tfp pilus assembly protein PilF